MDDCERDEVRAAELMAARSHHGLTIRDELTGNGVITTFAAMMTT
jgi:hypothetical protein